MKYYISKGFCLVSMLVKDCYCTSKHTPASFDNKHHSVVVMSCLLRDARNAFEPSKHEMRTTELCLLSDNGGNLTHHSGHLVGSTVSEAASAPTDSWKYEMGERHQGVCSEALGTHPVWVD